ncbi:hypothetical protein [Rubneribacter sp.]|nr:hypothetical protein [Candidatus Rubneribacter avistercoris]
MNASTTNISQKRSRTKAESSARLSIAELGAVQVDDPHHQPLPNRQGHHVSTLETTLVFLIIHRGRKLPVRAIAVIKRAFAFDAHPPRKRVIETRE